MAPHAWSPVQMVPMRVWFKLRVMTFVWCVLRQIAGPVMLGIVIGVSDSLRSIKADASRRVLQRLCCTLSMESESVNLVQLGAWIVIWEWRPAQLANLGSFDKLIPQALTAQLYALPEQSISTIQYVWVHVLTVMITSPRSADLNKTIPPTQKSNQVGLPKPDKFPSLSSSRPSFFWWLLCWVKLFYQPLLCQLYLQVLLVHFNPWVGSQQLLCPYLRSHKENIGRQHPSVFTWF